MTDMMNFPSANHDCKFKFSRLTIILWGTHVCDKKHTPLAAKLTSKKRFSDALLPRYLQQETSLSA